MIRQKRRARLAPEDVPEVTLEVTCGGIDWQVMAIATSIGNSGIGPYEFWGSPGFDKGRDYVEDYEILGAIREDADGDEIDDVPGFESALAVELVGSLEGPGHADDAIRQALDEAMGECDCEGYEREDYEDA